MTARVRLPVSTSISVGGLRDGAPTQNKYKQTGHLIEARAATEPPSMPFHIAEFLIAAANYTCHRPPPAATGRLRLPAAATV
eukprot:SAG11_NODE_2776_length_2983_cov_2.095354_4_plen_82_part_00